MPMRKSVSLGNQMWRILGHVIPGEGVAADPGKIEAMKNWPLLKNSAKLRGF